MAVAPSGAFEGLAWLVVVMLIAFILVGNLGGICSACKLRGRCGRIIRSMDDDVSECDEGALGSSYILMTVMGNVRFEDFCGHFQVDTRGHLQVVGHSVGG